jgi:hypothetical protein
MKTDHGTTKSKRSVLKTILISLLLILITAAFLLYINFNNLLSRALMNSFNSSIISDVYELKFNKLNVNFFRGNIRVRNVSLLPRENPLQTYPYINSSLKLTTKEINLQNVEIRILLKSNKLILDRVLINRPDVTLMLNGKRHIIMPFADSTAVENKGEEKKKNALISFSLKEFQLIDAAILGVNSYTQRELKIRNFNISLKNLFVDQQPGKYLTSVSEAKVSIGTSSGDMKKGPLRHVSFKGFNIGLDSLGIEYTLDSLVHSFHDFNLGINDLNVETADSIFSIDMQSFALSYANSSIRLKGISFKPNVGNDVLQKKYKYQHAEFSGSVGTLNLQEINFDSLIFAQKLFIGQVTLDSVNACVFKDKTKPIYTKRIPSYLGQSIAGISLPLMIKNVKATNVHLENTERKADSTVVIVNISNANAEVKNITNLNPKSSLVMNADAYIEGKAHVKAILTFDYKKPIFGFEAIVERFNLSDLNPLIQAYTPAKITKGIVDHLTFSGLGGKTSANGTMEFLYHDLDIDMDFPAKAKWKSSVVAFAANTALSSSNPVSAGLPSKIVKFDFERDVNKGFVNVLIKSLLTGLKETMIMSKENRKEYKVLRKEAIQENKK